MKFLQKKQNSYEVILIQKNVFTKKTRLERKKKKKLMIPTLKNNVDVKKNVAAQKKNYYIKANYINAHLSKWCLSNMRLSFSKK